MGPKARGKGSDSEVSLPWIVSDLRLISAVSHYRVEMLGGLVLDVVRGAVVVGVVLVILGNGRTEFDGTKNVSAETSGKGLRVEHCFLGVRVSGEWLSPMS